jgi:hypothetical protein
MSPQFTWAQPLPWFDRNDFLFSDIRNALWKAVTIKGISTIAPGDTFTIYALTFVVNGIEAHEQITLTDNYGRGWTVPAWPWTAAGT